MMHLNWKKSPKRIFDQSSGILLLLLILLIFYSMTFFSRGRGDEKSFHQNSLYIQIDGDILDPGVYAFPPDGDLKDFLINRAGGALQDDQFDTALTLPPIRSGIKIVIQRDHKKWRFSTQEMSAFQKCTLGIPISLNRESQEGLTAIPGIGPGLAEAIVKERFQRGGFQHWEEILSIKGIGPKLFKKIRPFIIL